MATVSRPEPQARPAPRGERVLPRGAGLGVIYQKELSDHFSGYRFALLLALVMVAGLASLYVAAQTLRETLTNADARDPFVFLRLFTTEGESLPSFTFFVGFLGPLLGIALGFDAINGERNRGTLSRLVSQPIYRDAIINGKFLAGLSAIAAVLVAFGLLVGGLGLRMIGIPPTFEEFARLVLFVVFTVVYVGFWLALALLFSTLFRQTVASALGSLAVWLFFSLFAPLLFGLVADTVAPVVNRDDPAQLLHNARWVIALNRLAPPSLYAEAVQTLLNPEVRSLGPILLEQVIGAVPGAPLPLGQSLVLIWPHAVALVALTLVCFALAYVSFMRQEIRAGQG